MQPFVLFENADEAEIMLWCVQAGKAEYFRLSPEGFIDNFYERLDRLEKWRWFVVGVATMFGFILAQIPNISKIFQ